MPRRAAGISATAIRHLGPGRYADGNGLYLFVRSREAKFWLLRYVSPVTGKRREAGLGPAVGRGAVGLAAARLRAVEWRALIRDGRDPLAEREVARVAAKAARQASASAISFREVADRYIAAHEAGWRSAVHRQQWTSSLRNYAHPYFGDRPVADVDTAHVMAALEAIWRAKPETASRLRARIELVLDYAKARGWRSGENPARWRGHVANMLPKRSKMQRVAHHPAMPWREVPEFMLTLRAEAGLAPRALDLTILTAARTSEVLNARWSEFDLERAIWTVPAERMKGQREHRVPLSEPAMALLRSLLPLRDPARGDWVFPGAREGRSLSDTALAKVLARIGHHDVTVHGFRSGFRDWVAETTGYSGEVAEAALAHVVGNGVEAAYRRGDLFEKRRRLMEDWAQFCAGPGLTGTQPAR
jgi:integrase